MVAVPLISGLIFRCFVRNFWPSPIPHMRLKSMYDNVVAREREKEASTSKVAVTSS